MSSSNKNDHIKTRSVISRAHESRHAVVNITLAQFLKKPKIERTGLYLIGLAFYVATLREEFASDKNLFWIIINFRTGNIIMRGDKGSEPNEEELERIQRGVGEVCFLYDKDVLSWI